MINPQTLSFNIYVNEIGQVTEKKSIKSIKTHIPLQNAVNFSIFFAVISAFWV